MMPVVDEKRKISMNKNRNNITVKIKKSNLVLLLLPVILALLLLASCNGVVPEPPIPPGPDDDVAGSHKITDMAPYYEIQKDDYCVIAGGVIISNYKIKIPNKKLTQDEVGDAIFLGPGIGAYLSSLVAYINNRKDLDIQAKYKSLTFLQIQKMIEDDIPALVKLEDKNHAVPIIGYNKMTNEITIYSTLDGKEHTMYEFKYLDPNYNNSAIIINNSELSTYLDNLL